MLPFRKGQRVKYICDDPYSCGISKGWVGTVKFCDPTHVCVRFDDNFHDPYSEGNWMYHYRVELVETKQMEFEF